MRDDALCRLESSLLKDADAAITSNDVGAVERLCDQITYTRHKKLWAYSDKLSRREDVKARLGRAKTYVDLGNPEEARKDILAAKAVRGQKEASVQVSQP